VTLDDIDLCRNLSRRTVKHTVTSDLLDVAVPF